MTIKKKKQSFICEIEKIMLSPSTYRIGLQILDLYNKQILYENEYFDDFIVEEGDVYSSGKIPIKRKFRCFYS